MLGAAPAAAAACLGSCRCSRAQCALKRVCIRHQTAGRSARSPSKDLLPSYKPWGMLCSQASGHSSCVHARFGICVTAVTWACWPQDGGVWEKAGVGVSVVYGTMPPEAYRAARGAAAVKSPNGNGVR